ncbi:MAG: class I SAM-dependent methyltransferase [Alphaproteobacteria bacterium]|nr:class I SAM-dependent methyltransferase [Alphaproteobacteria bacterium]
MIEDQPAQDQRVAADGLPGAAKAARHEVIWERQVSLFPDSDHIRRRIAPAAAHRCVVSNRRFANLDWEPALSRDQYPLPSPKAREGYYGDGHFEYWLSGLRDSTDVIRIHEESGGPRPQRFLDFGGASGRVARHMAFVHGIEQCYLCDINREHINFVVDVFGGRIRAFQSTSMPHLPIEDNYFDVITAYSVFSHIETFDETWLYELRRILKPGGMLFVTAYVDKFEHVNKTWPVYAPLANHPDFDKSRFGKPLSEDRLVVRWRSKQSYSSLVFLTSNYVNSRWKPAFKSFEIIQDLLPFQSALIMRK